MRDIGEKIQIGLVSGFIVFAVVTTGYTLVKKFAGNRQTFDVPCDGTYTIELNGANSKLIIIED